MEAVLGRVADAVSAAPDGRVIGGGGCVAELRERAAGDDSVPGVFDAGVADRQRADGVVLPDGTPRLKGSGKRWDADNAEAVMALDALRASGLWQTYWRTLLPVTSQVRPKVLPDPSEAGAHITELHSEVETKWSGIEELEYTDEFILVIFAGLFSMRRR